MMFVRGGQERRDAPGSICEAAAGAKFLDSFGCVAKASVDRLMHVLQESFPG